MTESATSNWLNEDRISGLLRLYFCLTDILSSSIFLQGVDQEILPCGRIDDDDDEDEEVDHTDTHNHTDTHTITQTHTMRRTWEQWQQRHCQGCRLPPTTESQSLPSKALCREPPRWRTWPWWWSWWSWWWWWWQCWTHRGRWTRTRKIIKSLVGRSLQVVELILINHVIWKYFQGMMPKLMHVKVGISSGSWK